MRHTEQQIIEISTFSKRTFHSHHHQKVGEKNMLPLRKCRRSKSRTSSPQLRAEAFIVIALNVLAYLTAAADSSGCGGDLTEDYGVVVSPEFPQPYPADVSCLWHIAPNVTETNGTDSGLKLTFVQFHTQPADGSGGSGDVETLLVYTSDPNNATSLVSLKACCCFPN